MDPKFCRTLLAGAIAALLAAPAFATTTKTGAQAPTKTEAGQVGQPQSTPGQTTGPAADQEKSPRAVANLQEIDNLIYSWSADALRGKEIVDQSGDEIGKVENVLLAPDRKSVHVVISMGGVVGIGSREVLVSLDELRAVDDKLRMSATEEQIEALPDYPPKPYTELKGESPLIGSLVERSALERGRDSPGSTSGSTPESTPESTITGMTQRAADQEPETGQARATGRQMNASPEAAARTGSTPPPAPGTVDPPSSRSATSQSTADVAKTQDASRSTQVPQREARDRSTERPEAASAAPQMIRGPLYGRSADNLKDTKVVDRARNEVGTVEKVVLTPDHKSAFVVIDLDGGFLGLGSRSIVVSLDELEAVDDGLMMNVTKEAVLAHRDYSPKHYIELTGNRPITEFSAFEPVKDTSGPADLPAEPKRSQ